MNLQRAIEIAAEAHREQTDKAGAPYLLHPLRVMMLLETDDERIVGILHDVVEDGPGWTFERLEEEGFSPTAYSTEDGHQVHGIVGSHSTPRAVWPTGAWTQARPVGSSGFIAAARLRMLSPARGRRWALWTSRSRMASARVGSPMASCQCSTGS